MVRQITTMIGLALCLTSIQAQLLIGQTAGYSGIVGPGVQETAAFCRPSVTYFFGYVVDLSDFLNLKLRLCIGLDQVHQQKR